MRKLRPELFFLIAVLGAGLWSAVITPLGAGFDEDAHLARVWQIAHGEMIPNKQGSADGFPSGFLGVSYHLYKNMTHYNMVSAELINPLEMVGGYGHIKFVSGAFNPNRIFHETTVDVEKA